MYVCKAIFPQYFVASSILRATKTMYPVDNGNRLADLFILYRTKSRKVPLQRRQLVNQQMK